MRCDVAGSVAKIFNHSIQLRFQLPTIRSLTKLFKALPLALSALILSACSTVESRAPVGVPGKPLDAKVWNGTWSSDGSPEFTTRVKNAESGIVEFTSVKPVGPDEPSSIDVTIRELAGQTVGSAILGKSGLFSFGRIAITDKHLVIFPPNTDVFSTLLKAKVLSGKPVLDEKGKETGSSIVEHLSEEDISALEKYAEIPSTAFRLEDLFEDDPALVYIRLK